LPITILTKKLANKAPTISANRYKAISSLAMYFVIKNPTDTAGLKCAIDIFPKRYTAIATPTKGANAINGNPRTPLNFALITTEPWLKQQQ